jgi:predicted XRE-type DNA-binding protein
VQAFATRRPADEGSLHSSPQGLAQTVAFAGNFLPSKLLWGRAPSPVQAEQRSAGQPHPEQELLKAKLTLQIYRLIKRRSLKQTEAGKILGIRQPHVSALMRNRAGAFSVERLMDFLTALGQDVEIIVRPTRKPHGEVSVVA